MSPNLLYQTTVDELIAIADWIGKKGWCPATGGNFSVRLDHHLSLVTASGVDKTNLQPDDFLVVKPTGVVHSGNKQPSAETLLHTTLYDLSLDIGAVLHTHTVAATVLSNQTRGNNLTIQGYEMQKALNNVTTHETPVILPILDNNQDMKQLAVELKQRWQLEPFNYGFLVRGHGLYAWGQNLKQAQRHLEGLEFLLSCELNRMLLEARFGN
ncbi:MAG: methylthioribulose 1-phosphate dehydratase [Waterburya sp.]